MDEALRHIKRVDPLMYAAMRTYGKALSVWPKRMRHDRLFSILCESVVSQQLSVKAADTIWGRLKTICGGEVSPHSIRSTSLSNLRKAGLSAAKAKTLKAIAKTRLDFPALRKNTPEEAMATLTAIWGVGPWTAEMFLMFGLGHPDIFSSRDLGLVRAMEELYSLTNPSRDELETIALRWSPHRTLASRILWKLRDS
jgi:DNA-3-methyladenine glycosylase II